MADRGWVRFLVNPRDMDAQETRSRGQIVLLGGIGVVLAGLWLLTDPFAREIPQEPIPAYMKETLENSARVTALARFFAYVFVAVGGMAAWTGGVMIGTGRRPLLAMQILGGLAIFILIVVVIVAPFTGVRMAPLR